MLNENQLLLLFLSENFLKFDLICLFGIYELIDNCYNVTFLFASACNSKNLKVTIEKVLELYQCEQMCVGILVTNSKLNVEEVKMNIDISFILRINLQNQLYDFHSILFKNQIVESKNIKIILFNGNQLFSSELLPLTVNYNNDVKNSQTFLHFLLKNSNLKQNIDLMKPFVIVFPKENSWWCHFFMNLNKIIIIATKTLNGFYIHNKMRTFIKILKISSVGGQLCMRINHIKSIIEDIQRNNFISLKCRNLISSIIIDILLGILVTILIQHYVELNELLEVVLIHTNYVVNELQKLLYWLMGVPAGLKLNRPLNNALGHFFLYHIYLWKTYMAIIKPVFVFVMESFTLIGLLGVTFLLTLFNDLISLATIHIYCFYGYAARLFGLQVLGMTALWRLFWGKKWNPLRQRVDSYTYDVHQLFVGTLMFTVLLFLLPTVMLYYIVFTMLRLVVLTIQGIIGRTVSLLNIFPVFVILLRILGSSRVKGDLQFTVSSSSINGPTVLCMKVIHIPYMSVIKMTLPLDDTEDQKPSWKSLLSSLIWGRIIYPL